MTDQQLPLIDIPATPRPLTRNQRLAHDYLRDHPGVTVDEIGAWIHAHNETRPHSIDVRCDWCAKTGRQTVTSKALAPLVTYTRAPGGHLYRLRTPTEQTAASVPVREPTEAELQADPFVGL